MHFFVRLRDWKVGTRLAFGFGLLAQRLRMSPLAGYLLAGVVVGPFMPALVGDHFFFFVCTQFSSHSMRLKSS